MRMIDKIIDENEKVLWEGKPKFLPFFIGSFFVSLFGLFFLMAGILLYLKEGLLVALLFPHTWFGILFTIGPPLYSALVYKNVFYAITNKRVIIQKGLIGIDFDIIDYDQITNASVNVDLIDKLFGGGSGSITIYTPSTVQIARGGIFSSSRVPTSITTPYAIRHIDNPYEVFKFFKKVSHDVKTDIEFPNKYRPNKNPGYKTEYNPKKIK